MYLHFTSITWWKLKQSFGFQSCSTVHRISMNSGKVLFFQCKRISDAPTAAPSMMKEDFTVRTAGVGSTMLKEDLFLRAARNKINRTIQQLNEMLTMPSHPRKSTPGRSYCDSARKILNDSASVTMNECDQTFIRWCIQDCLWRTYLFPGLLKILWLSRAPLKRSLTGANFWISN